MTRREKESQKATEQRSLSVVSPKKAQAQVHTHAHAIQQEPHDRTTTRRYARTQVQNTYKVNGINQRPMIQNKGKGEYGYGNVQENGRQALGQIEFNAVTDLSLYSFTTLGKFVP